MHRSRVGVGLAVVLAAATVACGPSPTAVPTVDGAAGPPTPVADATSSVTQGATPSTADVADGDDGGSTPQPTAVAASPEPTEEPNPGVPTQTTAAPSAPPFGTWRLLRSEPEVGEPNGRQTQLSVVEEAGRLLAVADTACNRGGAELTIHGDQWHLGEFSQSAMGCDDAEERAAATFVTALTSVTTWQLRDEVLVLTGPDVRLQFARSPAA